MSSSYYFKLYKEEKEKAKKYEKWIKQLQPIQENASSKLEDEIRDVNKEITRLYEDLNDAVKHDQVFASEAYEIGSSMEAGSGSDRYLRETQSAIYEEIRRIAQKKDEAERKSVEYQRKYEEEKRREQEEERRKREEFLESLMTWSH